MAAVKERNNYPKFIDNCKVANIQVRVQEKPITSSAILVSSSSSSGPLRDVWVYKAPKVDSGPKIQLSSAAQHIPLQIKTLASASQGQQKLPQILTSSQRYIIANPSYQVFTNVQSQMRSIPKVVNTAQGPITNVVQMVTAPSKLGVNLQQRTSLQQITVPSNSGFNPQQLTSLQHITLPTKLGVNPQQHTTLQQIQQIPRLVTNTERQFQIISHPDSLEDEEDDDNKGFSVVDIDDEDDILDDSSSKDSSLQCMDCSATFATAKELEQHEHNHLGEVNYICDQCGKEFSTKKTFDQHLRTHTSEKKFECDTCYKKFDYRDNLIFHMRIHGENRCYKCYVCNKKFGNRSMRDNHLLKHRTCELNMQQTPSTSDDGKIKAVIVPKHKITKDLSKEKGMSVYKIPSVYKDKVVYFCDVCSKLFSDKKSLEIHKLSHIDKKKTEKILKKNDISEKNYILGNGVAKFICSKCSKVFNNEHFYKCHVTICAGIEENASKKQSSIKQNAVTCAFCKKNYNVVKQANDDGSQSMKFICEPCCTFLAQKSQVSGFTPRLENRFICNKCDKCFASEDQLRRHILSQCNSTGHCCDECGRCFSSQKSLRIHQNVHRLAIGKMILRKQNSAELDESISECTAPKRTRVRKVVLARQKSEALEEELEGLTSKKKRESYTLEEELEGLTAKKKRESDSGTKSSVLSPSKKQSNSFDLNDNNDGFNCDWDGKASELVSDPVGHSLEMESAQMTIKQEPDDEELDLDAMENCTIFNAAPSQKRTLPLFSMPDPVIKQEPSSDEENLEVQIKKEKISEDEVTIKEEPEAEFPGLPVKQEKPEDDSNLFLPEEFEFTPFGDPVKKEDFLED